MTKEKPPKRSTLASTENLHSKPYKFEIKNEKSTKSSTLKVLSVQGNRVSWQMETKSLQGKAIIWKRYAVALTCQNYHGKGMWDSIPILGQMEVDMMYHQMRKMIWILLVMLVTQLMIRYLQNMVLMTLKILAMCHQTKPPKCGLIIIWLHTWDMGRSFQWNNQMGSKDVLVEESIDNLGYDYYYWGHYWYSLIV